MADARAIAQLLMGSQFQGRPLPNRPPVSPWLNEPLPPDIDQLLRMQAMLGDRSRHNLAGAPIEGQMLQNDMGNDVASIRDYQAKSDNGKAWGIGGGLEALIAMLAYPPAAIPGLAAYGYGSFKDTYNTKKADATRQHLNSLQRANRDTPYGY